MSPHITDNFGDFCDFGSRIVSLDSVIDFPSIEEKSGECSFGSRWLRQINLTLSEFSFLPIIYNLLIAASIYGLKSFIISYLIQLDQQTSKQFKHLLIYLINSFIVILIIILSFLGPLLLRKKIMITFYNTVQALFYCLIFVAAILLSQTLISYKKIDSKPHQSKIKIVILTITTIIITLSVYSTHCSGEIGFLECVYLNPGQQLMRNIGIALFINTSLFLGGLHQWLYNGQMKRKFLRFYKKQFQWDLFKKLFIVPLCVQLIYRAIICRIIDPNFEHPSFFTFFSAILFSASHYINYYKLSQQYGKVFALKTSFIQATYNLIFGLYISHIFARQRALISSLVLQVYANFLGYPQYFEILKGNIEDERVQKSALFYFVGAIACLSCCLLI